MHRLPVAQLQFTAFIFLIAFIEFVLLPFMHGKLGIALGNIVLYIVHQKQLFRQIQGSAFISYIFCSHSDTSSEVYCTLFPF